MMTRTLRQYALLATLSLAGSSFLFTGCSKRDANLETDYNSKKASAETLISQINQTLPGMMKDHDQWMTTLNQAAQKPGADTAKINSIKQQMMQHDSSAKVVVALEDSVKNYMSATADQGDAFKTADDRLTSNFDDLNSKWKSLQDQHENLMQSVQQFAVNTAGNAVADTAHPNQAAGANQTSNPHTTAHQSTGGAAKNTGTSAGTSSNAGANPHETARHSTGGAAKNTGTATPQSTNNGTTNGGANAHETTRHSSGGAAKSTH